MQLLRDVIAYTFAPIIIYTCFDESLRSQNGCLLALSVLAEEHKPTQEVAWRFLKARSVYYTRACWGTLDTSERCFILKRFSVDRA